MHTGTPPRSSSLEVVFLLNRRCIPCSQLVCVTDRIFSRALGTATRPRSSSLSSKDPEALSTPLLGSRRGAGGGYAVEAWPRLGPDHRRVQRADAVGVRTTAGRMVVYGHRASVVEDCPGADVRDIRLRPLLPSARPLTGESILPWRGLRGGLPRHPTEDGGLRWTLSGHDLCGPWVR